ncbi:hypothetical protein D3C80_1629890 [compost metagenome]
MQSMKACSCQTVFGTPFGPDIEIAGFRVRPHGGDNQKLLYSACSGQCGCLQRILQVHALELFL